VPLLLTGNADIVHGILASMRFVATAGATRNFDGPEADLVIAMAEMFTAARPDLELDPALLDQDSLHSSSDLALHRIMRDLPMARERHEAMVAATLCALVGPSFDEQANHAVKQLADAFGLDSEMAERIDQLSGEAASRAGADLLRHFISDRSGVAESIIQARLDAGEEPLETPPQVFAAYAELLHASPAGSAGAELLRFYNHTGFSIPGSPKTPPLEVLGAHDLNHVLAGYPTTAEGEVYVALFTAANAVDAGLDYLAAVLVQWHHDVKIGVFDPSRSDLRPDLLAEAVRRGSATATDLSNNDFAWRELLHLPLGDAREAIGVVGEGLVSAGGAWDALGRGDR